MRHPHGLRSAAAGAAGPAIGAAYDGGFFAGEIRYQGIIYYLIVAPRATGATGTGYTLTTNKTWKTSDTTTNGTLSDANGAANSANMNDASHPAAQFCETLSIGGYSDWYLPARYELDIAYENLKPTTGSNSTSWGINAYSVPARASNRTAGAPAQTSVTAFQTGGAEAFVNTSHWSSTELSAANAWLLYFDNGQQVNSSKSGSAYVVRAFRREVSPFQVNALNPLGLIPGDSFEGGFFAGYISHTANSVPTHALIVAPAATGATGTGYTLTTMKQWKTTNTTTAGTTSDFNGSANSSNMNDASHPAAQFCENLSIGGYSDWYLPARYETDIAYENLKPTTASNDTSAGVNSYSVPKRTVNRTAGDPAQTSVAAFQSGGAEAFVAGAHWVSTEDGNPVFAWGRNFSDGDENNTQNAKTVAYRVRAFRKVAV